MTVRLLRQRWSLETFDLVFFFFQAEDGIRDYKVTGVQTCALPILECAELLPFHELEIPVQHIPSGIYWLQVKRKEQ